MAIGLAGGAIQAQAPCPFMDEPGKIVTVGGRAFLSSGRSLVELETAKDVCLSCHDGTIANGVRVASRELDDGERRGVLFARSRPHGSAGGNHPVDVPYPSGNPEYVPRFALDRRLELDNDMVTCRTCHGDGSAEYSLSVSRARSRLCLSCHLK
ncbi:MAG: hypothetical protein ACE5EG_03495 [Thermoanaerobaculia bacterium]